jgi:hypothetical protein
VAQLFKPYANVVARTSIVLGGAAPVLIGLSIAAYSRSPYNTKVEVPLNQPIPFSHQHHVVELGLDCRYCHTSVEKSSYAGIPPTETCMSCHSQIWTNSPLIEPARQSLEQNLPIEWKKVNTVPQFVNFNHSIHVARGVNCNQCHGAVNDMQITYKGRPFQMQWCLQCHRAPERYLYNDGKSASPRIQVFALYQKLQEHGVSGLSPREQALVRGLEQESNSPEDVASGRAIVESLGVKVQQLADCSVCHY